MRSVGDCYDNAMCESFCARLERELLDHVRFQRQAEARIAVFQFIEGWYNPHRRYAALSYLSSDQDERSVPGYPSRVKALTHPPNRGNDRGARR